MLERVVATRVVSTKEGLKSLLSDARWPADRDAVQLAFDELLILEQLDESLFHSHDPHAIVVQDASFFAIRLTPQEGARILEEHCEWAPPSPREFPGQAQGAVAGIPTKILFRRTRWILLVQSPYVAEFQERVL